MTQSDGASRDALSSGPLPLAAGADAPILLLHIGRGKTGSSTLQEFLKDNRETLRRFGWSYPQPVNGLLPGRSDGEQAGNLAWLARGLRKSEPEFLRMAEQALTAQFSTARSANLHVILSTETIYRTKERGLRWLRDCAERAGYRTVVLCFVREQVDFLISSYAQQVKKREIATSLADYLDSVDEQCAGAEMRRVAHLYYDSMFDRFERIFGRENIVVRLFERDVMSGGDVRREFLQTTGLSPEEFMFGYSENVSGSADALNLLWRVNEIDQHNALSNPAFLDFYAKRLPDERSSLYDLVEQRQIDRLRQHFVASNERFRARYFPNQENLFRLRTGSPKEGGVSSAAIGVLIDYFTEKTAAAARQQEQQRRREAREAKTRPTPGQ